MTSYTAHIIEVGLEKGRAQAILSVLMMEILVFSEEQRSWGCQKMNLLPK